MNLTELIEAPPAPLDRALLATDSSVALAPRTRLCLLLEALSDIEPAFGTLAPSAASAQMAAEAVNLLAKRQDHGWYAVKPTAIAIAVDLGAGHGWGDDGAFYLDTPEAGVSSFHGDVPRGGRWPHPWSGVPRQHLALDLVRDARLLRVMARATSPEGGHPLHYRYATDEWRVRPAHLLP